MLDDNEFLTRMLATDPKYGTQDHQRRYVERMAEAQRLAPCSEKHEHNGRCYPDAILKQVTQ